MKKVYFIFPLIAVVLLAYGIGCENETVAVSQNTKNDIKESIKENKICSDYAPAKLEIIPLTEIIQTKNGQTLIVYLKLLDKFNCQIKSPGVFRFELYDYIERTSDPKGRQIHLWPDIDLTDAQINNRYWIDFMRVYKFRLDFEHEANGGYVLQATCICPNGKRLNANLVLGK